MITMGIDASSNSIAYAVMNDKSLVNYGELFFVSKKTSERIRESHQLAVELFDKFKPERLVIEDAVFVQNQAVLITLAMYFGAILSASPCDSFKVKPMVWQNYIGNKILNKVQKEKIKVLTPGKSETWYKTQYRAARKDFTRQWVKTTFGKNIVSDNITDAIGINWWLVCNSK